MSRSLLPFVFLVLVCDLGCRRKAFPTTPAEPIAAAVELAPAPPRRMGRRHIPLTDVPEPGTPLAPVLFTTPADDTPRLAGPGVPEGRRLLGVPVATPVASLDGTTVAFTTAERQGPRLAVWDVKTAREIGYHQLQERDAGLIALSPNGSRLYVGGSTNRFREGKLRVWDVRTGKCLKERTASLWALSADRRTLATLDHIIGDIDPGFHPDDTSDVVPWHAILTLWDVDELTPRRSFTYVSFIPITFAVSPDGSKVVCGRGAVATLFDTITGKPLRKFELGDEARYRGEHAFLFTPDSNTIATWNTHVYPGVRTLLLLDVATGAKKTLIARTDCDHSNQPTITGMAFTPDSKKCVVGFDDAVVLIDVEALPRPRGEVKTGFELFQRHTEFVRGGIQPDALKQLHRFDLPGDGKTAILDGWFSYDPYGLGVVEIAPRKGP